MRVEFLLGPRMKRPVGTILFALLLKLSLSLCVASAGSSLHLRLPPITDRGSVPGWPGWVELDALTFDDAVGLVLSRDRPVLSSPTFTIQLTKRLDFSSVPLMVALNRGTVYPEAIIEFIQEDGARRLQYQLQLKGVVVKQHSLSGAGGGAADPPSEYLQLFSAFIAAGRRYLEPEVRVMQEELAWWDAGRSEGGSTLPGLDTDGDGLPDDFEVANALDRLRQDAEADLDGDGLSNGLEFLAGTAANDANSVLRITRVEPGATASDLKVFWFAVAGRKYEVLTSREVQSGYAVVSSALAGTTGEISLSIPGRRPTTFLRVRLVP